MSTPTYPDLWPLIQEDIFGVISAEPFFADCPGQLIEPGDIESNIQAKLASILSNTGKRGAGFLMLPIEQADDENANMPQGPLKLPIDIQFVENVTINRSATGTKIPIRVYAAVCHKLLKLYTPVFLTQNLIPAKPCIHLFTPERDRGLRVGQVSFSAYEADATQYSKVARPVITAAGSVSPQTVTIACGTAGATIYYTVDGTHPSAENNAAVVYAGPVNVMAAGMVRARAFKQGSFGSDTAAAIFS